MQPDSCYHPVLQTYLVSGDDDVCTVETYGKYWWHRTLEKVQQFIGIHRYHQNLSIYLAVGPILMSALWEWSSVR
jgi:hypothetical protein